MSRDARSKADRATCHCRFSRAARPSDITSTNRRSVVDGCRRDESGERAAGGRGVGLGIAMGLGTGVARSALATCAGAVGCGMSGDGAAASTSPPSATGPWRRSCQRGRRMKTARRARAMAAMTTARPVSRPRPVGSPPRSVSASRSGMPAEATRGGGFSLTRTSHRLPAATADAPHPAGFSRFGVLDVPSSTPPRPARPGRASGSKAQLGAAPRRPRYETR